MSHFRSPALLLPLLLLGGWVGALGSGCAPASHSPASEPVDWETVADDPARRETLVWMGPLGFSEGRAGGWIQRQLEERFNLDLRPVFLDAVSYGKTRALRFTAGDVPDVFWDGDPLGVQRKAHHGFVLELPPELLLRHAPHYVDYLNRHAPEAWMYAFWHGKLWGLPTVNPNSVYPAVAVWREDWLRKVGLDHPPRTLEEMHEAFRRFTRDDPDGNGRDDTYGFSPPAQHWSLFFSEFFAARGVLPFDLQSVDGEITWGGIRPEAATVLALLRDWYVEGLIDPDFVLNLQETQSQEAFLRNKVGYFANVNMGQELDLKRPNSLYAKLRQSHPGAELVPAAPVAGFDGRPHIRVWGAAAHILQFSRALEREPQKVVRVLRMLDTLVSDPGLALEQIMGKRGLHWDYNDTDGVVLLPPYDGKAGGPELLGPRRYESIGFFMVCGLPLEVVRSLRTPAAQAMLDRYARPEWGMTNAFGKTDVLSSASDSLADLRILQMKFYIEIIRGDRPLSDFDRFTQLWRSRGGDELLAEARQFLQDRQRIYTRMGVTPPHTP